MSDTLLSDPSVRCLFLPPCNTSRIPRAHLNVGTGSPSTMHVITAASPINYHVLDFKILA